MKSYKHMCESTTELSKELYKAIQTGGGSIEIIDKVEKNNMSAVTSNAVYDAVNKDSKTGKVTVKVIDDKTQIAITNAIVKLDEETLTTKNNGECIFKDVTYGVHVLKVSNANYTDCVEGINVKEDFKKVSIKLFRSSSVITDCTLNIIALDKTTSSPIENAIIEINNQSLKTNNQGKCTFKDLPSATYTITAQHDDYNKYTSFITLINEKTDCTIYLVGKQIIETIRVTGNIIDDKGALPDVKVTELNSKISRYSQEDGTYILDIPKTELGPIITLEFNKNYYVLNWFEMEVESDIDYYSAGIQTLELANDQIQNSNVNGIAQYQDELIPELYYPATYLNLKFKNKLNGNIYNSNTGESGEFTQYGISAGWYDIEIFNNREYQDEIITNAFFVRPDEIYEGLKVLVTKATSHEFILGVRYTDSGKTVENTYIEIYSNETLTDKIAEGITDPLGRITFTVLNTLKGHIWAKIYISTEDIRTADIGPAGLSKQNISI